MPAGSHRFQAGSIGCTVLSDGYVSNPASWHFPDAAPQDLSGALEARKISHETVVAPYTCLLIETGRNVVLVDTGAGPSERLAGALIARLDMAGIRPRDVDTVILTHAHPDHIGGAVDARARPTFPNARYVLSEIEWEFWMAGGSAKAAGPRVPDDLKAAYSRQAFRALSALRHQVEFADREAEIVTGVRIVPAPGHTPGHLALIIASGGQGILNLADAATHPLHLEHPDWENGFDFDPVQAQATRRQLVERALAENLHVMAFHFPFPSVGSVTPRDTSGWTWTPGW